MGLMSEELALRPLPRLDLVIDSSAVLLDGDDPVPLRILEAVRAETPLAGLGCGRILGDRTPGPPPLGVELLDLAVEGHQTAGFEVGEQARIASRS